MLTIPQVHGIIDAANSMRIAVYFWTVCSLGMRMQEGPNLRIGDFDAARGMVQMHRDKQIEACDDSSVTFRCTPSGAKRSKTRTVSGLEFVGGFVQHTVPLGIQKIRYNGWMSPNSRLGRDEVKWLVWLTENPSNQPSDSRQPALATLFRLLTTRAAAHSRRIFPQRLAD